MHRTKCVFFRTEGGGQFGYGHLQRCFVLSEYFFQRGLEPHFICANQESFLVKKLKRYPTHKIETSNSEGPGRLSEAFDAHQTLEIVKEYEGDPWVIVDHYGLAEAWEEIIRSHCLVAAIEDLQDRSHAVDVLISDQNIRDSNIKATPGGIKPRILGGPKFALMEADFCQPHTNTVLRPRKILVTYGASDPTGETEKAIKALQSVQAQLSRSRELAIEIIVGPSNAMYASIKELADRYGYSVRYAPDSLVGPVLAADIVLTAGGNTMLECIAAKRGALVTVTAENQSHVVSEWEQKKLIKVVGASSDVTSNNLAKAIYEFMLHAAEISARLLQSDEIDGQGAERIYDAINSIDRDCSK